MLNFTTLNNYPIKISSSFHGYDFIQLLGRGSTSIVLLVEDQITKEQYSAKVISKTDAINRDIYESVLREINVHKTLSHPNIIEFHDSFEIKNEAERDEYIVIVMEFCENGDLLSYSTNHGFKSEIIKKKVIRDFLKGVQYLHSNEISHGDIKAENILLDSHLNAKLCDFGYCRTHIRGGDEHKKGTLYYSAPELLTTGSFNTLKSDIYAIGITLYALYENEFPFDNESEEIIMRQIVNGCLSFKNNLDIKLRKLIEKCTDVNPDNRPTIDEILNDEYFNNNQNKSSSNKNKNMMNHDIANAYAYKNSIKRKWSDQRKDRFEYDSDDSDF